MGDNLVFAVRGSTGLFLKRGLGSDAATIYENKENPKKSPCEVFQFSNNGQLFAYCDSQRTRVIDISTGSVLLDTDLKRTKAIAFSPKDTHLLTYEQYCIYGQRTSENQKPEPNLRVFNLAEKKHVATLIAVKESTWKPQWSDDESVAVRLVGGELFFYKNNNFDAHSNKLVVPGMKSYALSSALCGGNLHIASYVAGSGSVPAKVQVRRVNQDFTLVANKTFFKSDSADLVWNQKGSALLIVSAVEVDASNKSYYGEQQVFMINVQTDESFIVPLSKNGPVYSAQWNPNGKEFAVCYGYMPAKLTIYNTRGDVVFDAPEGPRNEIYYNTFGTILLACGFGNIAKGKMEFWDAEQKKELISIDVPNTTQFQWAPDGQHFITATTTPRLRIDNCYRLWHYTGRLVHEVPYSSPDELWQVMFRPMRGYNKFEVKEITKNEKMQAGLLIKKKDSSHPLNNLPAGAVRQAGAYVPPHLRGKRGPPGSTPSAPGAAPVAIKPQLSDLDKKKLNLNKKITEIGKLKEKLAAGETLQKNQLEKINNEEQLVAELQALSC